MDFQFLNYGISKCQISLRQFLSVLLTWTKLVVQNYIENCHQISQIKILQGKLRSLSTSVPPVGQCRPPVDQCRTRGPTDSERERIHRRPIKNTGSYCNFTVFFNRKYCQIYYFSAPGACKIFDLSIVEYCSRPPLALFTSI